jgi:hypothetical protein
MMNKYNQVINDIFWRFLAGRAMRCNLFVRASQKDFTSIPNAKKNFPAMNKLPQLRFSGFEAGEWKQQRLGEVPNFLDVEENA